jgi:selenocysteine lyase/cysteine desulfurase
MRGATWTGPSSYELQPGARRFEQWESDVAARIGLGVAVDHALGWGIEAIAERNRHLAGGLRARLDALPGVTVADRGEVQSAIVTCSIEGADLDEVRLALRDERINVTVSPVTSAQLDLPHRHLDGLLRASVHYLTTDDELDRFTEALSRICGR